MTGQPLSRTKELERLLKAKKPAAKDPCIRCEREDDDGYDPYSDRAPEKERLFDCNPWK